MSEYWLISVPGEPTAQQAFDNLNNATSKTNNLSANYKFHVPDLKVGTLDQLVGLSDDLLKLDTTTEGIVRKLAAYLGDVLEDKKEKLMENLQANGVDINTYLTKFQWDMAKYPVKQSLRGIADIISKQVYQIEADLKTKANSYNQLKGSLQAIERKATGSLLTRNLGDLVQKEDFVLESEYLTTLVVVVSKQQEKDWLAKYEKLTDMIVPRSSKKIFEDSENSLFTVSLFSKVAEEFKLKARENKFMVRDFTYNEKELAAGKDEMNRLAADKKKQYGPLVRWLKVNFSEAFTAWIHVKALRVFVESVLRYGLPVNFQTILMLPNKKSTKKLREDLQKLYGHLDTGGLMSDKHSDALDMPGMAMPSGSDYYPYVFYTINADVVAEVSKTS
ncbi:V-type proton ATPase subunit C-like [Paramacrobiotus metropolitanus]|uniref:V-type proton ATPase subunit C-like n=1 Tax=Paramacrobiotus metropolitanus TaxID=2943436 RepID=UPI00244644D9|nr:V-type proton ATPase subunit C-like [Paramacrobiotus metropolitanus]